ncbi:hypothetical protein [Puniceibacterium sediminis]|uniref:Uncharacterized protein n=1 Tax=Puniceibacterium sediminis TaxID=1608407 RepID=A0A238VH14_9RHOB|nr:hypothetical protein [Puniceibacterium sediminis]SNR33536.1 hypothetical protein SAMN06265370_102146 [Puniceibacterium sediminis]
MTADTGIAFAAVTAIFAKAGVEGVNSDPAAFLGERLSAMGWGGVVLIALGSLMVACG